MSKINFDNTLDQIADELINLNKDLNKQKIKDELVHLLELRRTINHN
tara:strand:+ start:83 stop:223 length:141 start_codon:yes stop_codon:yes gene_type:complete